MEAWKQTRLPRSLESLQWMCLGAWGGGQIAATRTSQLLGTRGLRYEKHVSCNAMEKSLYMIVLRPGRVGQKEQEMAASVSKIFLELEHKWSDVRIRHHRQEALLNIKLTAPSPAIAHFFDAVGAHLRFGRHLLLMLKEASISLPYLTPRYYVPLQPLSSHLPPHPPPPPWSLSLCPPRSNNNDDTAARQTAFYVLLSSHDQRASWYRLSGTRSCALIGLVRRAELVGYRN